MPIMPIRPALAAVSTATSFVAIAAIRTPNCKVSHGADAKTYRRPKQKNDGAFHKTLRTFEERVAKLALPAYRL
jgi:hypothetical protein